MKPGFGVAAELLALACILALSPLMPMGSVFGVYVIVAELLATYLVHCPAHYFTGRILGVRFLRMAYGSSTLAKALPSRLSSLAKNLPILTLKVSRDSLSRISRVRAASMYVAGAAASVTSAFIIALAATPADSLPFALLAWAVAVGYLLFDVVFSPKSGDLARARRVLRS
jgi:hypothetical protein